MEIIDYNGEGRWTRAAILERYACYAAEAGIPPRDFPPTEHTERGRHWVYPAMVQVIAGIEADDPACVRIGIEFIGDDGKFMFGRRLKANTARALGRASLTPGQKQCIRDLVFGRLREGLIRREFRAYAKLVRKIGFDAAEVPDLSVLSPPMARYWRYFDRATEPERLRE